MRWASCVVLALLAACSSRVQVLYERDATADAGQDSGLPDASIPTPTGRFDIAVGNHHSCALHGGALYCWGSNAHGQLGLGDRVSRSSPARVGTALNFVQLALGEDFSCTLDSVGQVACVGRNEVGQLGIGSRVERLSLTQVSLPLPAVSIHAGWAHVCAILSSDELYCWGENSEGQLAQGDPFPADGTDRPSPVVVSGLRTRDAAAGQGHTCAVEESGQLSCWGRNSDGQLGAPSAPGQLRTPIAAAVPSARLVAASMLHTCIVTSEADRVLCWGENSGGQLGTGTRVREDVPTALQPLPAAFGLAASTFGTCAVTQDFELYCVGRNVEGQLGFGDTADRLSIAQVPVQADVRQVAMGPFHTCIQLTRGDVLCSGSNGSGELGVGDTERRNQFTVAMASGPPE